MISALFLIQSLLLCLSRGVVGQPQKPNTSLYIPGVGIFAGDLQTDEVIIASAVTTIAAKTETVFALVDAKPTVSNTLTLELSPTGASLQGSDDSLGSDDLDATLNITCSFKGDISDCHLSALIQQDGATVTLTTDLTETTSGFPVVGLNLAATTTTTTTPPASPTTGDNGGTGGSPPPPAKTNSAVANQASLGFIVVFVLDLLFM